MFDKDARLVVRNQRYLTMYGLSPDIVKRGCTLRELIRAPKEPGLVFLGDAEEYVPGRAQGARVRRARQIESIEIDNGRVVAVVTNPMPGGGWVATHEDITERRQAEDKIHFMARHDILTKLAQPAGVSGRTGEGAWRAAKAWPCCVWISIASSRPTIRSGIPWVTECCRPLRSGCRSVCGMAISFRAWWRRVLDPATECGAAERLRRRWRRA